MEGAKDPISSGLALEAFLPAQHWERTRADAFIMGAGGSSVALCSYLVRPEHDGNRPARVFVSNRSPRRLEEMTEIHRKQAVDVPVSYVHTPRPEDNDEVLRGLAPGSLVANATGLGKDAPGSPITDAARFPATASPGTSTTEAISSSLSRRAARSRETRPRRRGRVAVLHLRLACRHCRGLSSPIPFQGSMFDELCHLAEKEKGRE